jgi:hypothetical protein
MPSYFFSLIASILFLQLSCSDSENYQHSLLTKLEKWDKEEKIQTLLEESEKNLYPYKKKWIQLFESKNEIIQPKYTQVGKYVLWTNQDALSIYDFSSRSFDSIKLNSNIEFISNAESMPVGLLFLKDLSKNLCKLYKWDYKNRKKLNLTDLKFTIDCNRSLGIDSNGETGYLISENEIIIINLSKNITKKIQLQRTKFHPPFDEIKSKILSVSHGRGTFIFFGNYGSYFLYFFDGSEDKLYFIAKNVIKPYIYFDQKSHFYLLSGYSGKVNILKYHDTSMNNLPFLDDTFEIDNFSEPFSGSGEDIIYLYSKEKTLLLNYKNKKRKFMPFLCNELIGFLDEFPICIQKKKEIWIRRDVFDDFDFRVFNYFTKYTN